MTTFPRKTRLRDASWFAAGVVGGGTGGIAAMEVIGLPIVVILLALLVLTALRGGATTAALVGFGLAYTGVVIWAGAWIVTCADCSSGGNPYPFYLAHLALGLVTFALGAALLSRRRSIG